jgi:hypothetical protein
MQPLANNTRRHIGPLLPNVVRLRREHRIQNHKEGTPTRIRR